MKRTFLFAVAALAVGIVFATGAFAPAQAAEPKNVKIDYVKGKKGAVDFDHEIHNKTGKCADCHHKGGNVKCFDCHKAEKSETSKVNIKSAFHKQCKSCHKKAEKADPKLKEKGISKCSGCHK